MTSAAARKARKLAQSRIAVAMVLVALAGPASPKGTDLVAGRARNEAAAAGETRTYRLTLDQGQATEVTLHQRDAVGLELRWQAQGATTTALATEAGRESIVRATFG